MRTGKVPVRSGLLRDGTLFLRLSDDENANLQHEDVLEVVTTGSVVLYAVAKLYSHSRRTLGAIEVAEPHVALATRAGHIDMNGRTVRHAQDRLAGSDDEDEPAGLAMTIGIAKVFDDPSNVRVIEDFPSSVGDGLLVKNVCFFDRDTRLLGSE